MNYPYPSPPASYMHPSMSQAIQAFMLGGQLPPNCVIMAIPLQQAQQILPQLLMNSGLNNGGDPMVYPPQPSYYGPVPQRNYNYPIVPYKKSKKKISHPQQPHPNFYNSSSFDTYMEDLSWSRLFDRPSRRTSKQQDSVSKKSRSNSSSTETSTTSDETIRRVNVPNKQTSSSNTTSKQQTKGSLPFKYSSEFVPGIAKQQHQGKKIKSNDVFIIKKA